MLRGDRKQEPGRWQPQLWAFEKGPRQNTVNKSFHLRATHWGTLVLGQLASARVQVLGVIWDYLSGSVA